MTATGPSGPPPRRSSSREKTRPSSGRTPSTSKYPPLAQTPSTISVCPPGARLNRVDDHAKDPAKRSARSRICSQIGFVHDIRRAPLSSTMASCCGASTGSVRRIRLLRIEKIAVFAPIPRASDRRAMAVTMGVARSARAASRRSGMTLRRRIPSEGWQRYFLTTSDPLTGMPHTVPA